MQLTIGKMVFISFFFTLFFSWQGTVAQVYYEAPPLNAYLLFHKNGELTNRLNDTIATYFNKINDTTFRIDFLIKDKFVKGCYCVYRGSESRKKVLLRVNKGNRKINTQKEIVIRELVFSEMDCLNFLPADVLFYKKPEN